MKLMLVLGEDPRDYQTNDWVYQCTRCQQTKEFPDKQRRRPVCCSTLMEMVGRP